MSVSSNNIIEFTITTNDRTAVVQFDNHLLPIYESKNWMLSTERYLISTDKPSIFFHRLITNAPDGMKVDHINHIRTDNRLENLRVGTIADNNQNKPKQKNCTSSYYGVHVKNGNRYKVTFMYYGESICVGTYDTELKAAEMYDMYLVQNNIILKSFNFPDRMEEYKQRIVNNEIVKKVVINTSIYKGVNFDKWSNVYRATIMVDGNKSNLLRSKNEIDCAHAYDEYIVNHKLPNRVLNFPEKYPNFIPEKEIKTTCVDIGKGRDVKISINTESEGSIIEKSDYERVMYYHCKMSNGYVAIDVDGKLLKLSRYLMNVYDENVHVDHKHGDKLDNRKRNLRCSTAQNNSKNKGKSENKSSVYMGVTYDVNRNRWLARVGGAGKVNNIGSFEYEKDAARARDLFIMLILKDEYYRLNFKWRTKEIQKHKNLINKHLEKLN